jgi:hypothetical protein
MAPLGSAGRCLARVGTVRRGKAGRAWRSASRRSLSIVAWRGGARQRWQRGARPGATVCGSAGRSGARLAGHGSSGRGAPVRSLGKAGPGRAGTAGHCLARFGIAGFCAAEQGRRGNARLARCGMAGQHVLLLCAAGPGQSKARLAVPCAARPNAAQHGSALSGKAGVVRRVMAELCCAKLGWSRRSKARLAWHGATGLSIAQRGRSAVRLGKAGEHEGVRHLYLWCRTSPLN